jgi:hypothetical protein
MVARGDEYSFRTIYLRNVSVGGLLSSWSQGLNSFEIFGKTPAGTNDSPRTYDGC